MTTHDTQTIQPEGRESQDSREETCRPEQPCESKGEVGRAKSEKGFNKIPQLTEKQKLSFLAKISKTPTDEGCMEWTAGKTYQGYGRVGFCGMKFLAPRVAYFLETGIDPGDLCVCHTCDNPKCVNFNHLWLGTNRDNHLDKEMKGRGNQARGDSHGSRLHPESILRGEYNKNAKLTSADIPSILSDTRSQSEIARDLGVTQAAISLVKRRKTWSHVA